MNLYRFATATPSRLGWVGNRPTTRTHPLQELEADAPGRHQVFDYHRGLAAIRCEVHDSVHDVAQGELRLNDPPPARTQTPAAIDCVYGHRVLPELRAEPKSPSGLIPFRNLKRSLSVERTSVVPSLMMDL
jgi:hypothetical protein